MKEYIVYKADAFHQIVTEQPYWTNPDGSGLFRLVNGAMAQDRGTCQFSARDKTELIRKLNTELNTKWGAMVRLFKTRAGADRWLAKRGQS